MKTKLIPIFAVLAMAGCGVGIPPGGTQGTGSQPILSGDACAIHDDAQSCNADTQDGCQWVETALCPAILEQDGGIITCGGGACIGPSHGGGCGTGGVGGTGGAVDGGPGPYPPAPSDGGTTNPCSQYTDQTSCDANSACEWLAGGCPVQIDGGGSTCGGCYAKPPPPPPDPCSQYSSASTCDANAQCEWLASGCPTQIDGGGSCPPGACVSKPPPPAPNPCSAYTDAKSCDADTSNNCYWFAAACPQYVLQDGGTAPCNGGVCVQEVSCGGGTGGGSGGGAIDGGVSAGCGCAAPAGTTTGPEVCVEQVGGPASSTSAPDITCQPLASNCSVPAGTDPCVCVTGEGTCKASPTVQGLCICDNGIR